MFPSSTSIVTKCCDWVTKINGFISMYKCKFVRLFHQTDCISVSKTWLGRCPTLSRTLDSWPASYLFLHHHAKILSKWLLFANHLCSSSTDWCSVTEDSVSVYSIYLNTPKAKSLEFWPEDNFVYVRRLKFEDAALTMKPKLEKTENLNQSYVVYVLLLLNFVYKHR
jgi:predicted YcjX-like family ATPase